MIEAQQRLKALQIQEKERFRPKDKFDYLINKENPGKNENIRALDLEISRIPKPSSFKKPLFSIPDDTKIPKLFKVPLAEIPEKSENLPWKKGDLLDSLDLGSTNLKKLFQNRPKLCHSPGRQQNDDPDWLRENFRVSINEWAPKKIEVFSNVKPTKRVLTKNLIKIGTFERPEIGKPLVKETRKVFALNDKKQNLDELKLVENAKSKLSGFKQLKDEAQEEKKTGKNDLLEDKAAKDEVIPKVSGKKQSKFVNKFKAIPENNDEFLDCELECVNDEEEKLKASLARLDLKYLRLKHQTS